MPCAPGGSARGCARRCLGVAQSQVSRWESGRDRPRAENIEAIRRLIWGPEADPFVALRHFVTNSAQNLLLLDARHAIIARARPLQDASGPLGHWGWVLDPALNPAFAAAHRRYCEVMAHPNGIVGMAITLPFSSKGDDWVATLNQTIHSAGGLHICLAELAFRRQASASDGVRFEETRLDLGGHARNSLTLWRSQTA